MDKCKACRRLLTNPVSQKHGYGPDCLRRAVAEGNAPLDSLEELKTWKRSKGTSLRISEQIPERCDKTIDMFEDGRSSAIESLHRAIAECEAVGVKVTFQLLG